MSLNLRADPPDVIDSGSYSITDIGGISGAAAGTALGTAVVGAGILGGVMLLNAGRERFESRTGVDTGSNNSGPSVTVH